MQEQAVLNEEICVFGPPIVQIKEIAEQFYCCVCRKAGLVALGLLETQFYEQAPEEEYHDIDDYCEF